MIEYDMPLYRPPSEGYNVIIQVTLGCSFNKCAFCSMYETKEYKERPLKEILYDIDRMSMMYNDATKVFLADGDAMNLPTDTLVEILKYLHLKFPKLRRISSYASPFNLLQKTLDELIKIRENGLSLIYYGIESGNYEILKAINKPMKAEKMVEGLNKATQAGLKISATVILGLGGKTFSKQHIDDTAKLINQCSLNYVSTLQLNLNETKEDPYFKKFAKSIGEFIWCSDKEMLEEQISFISQINTPKQIIFRSNHASNSLPLKGNLPRDKDRLVEELIYALEHEEVIRHRMNRGV